MSDHDAVGASVTEGLDHLAIARGRLRRVCQMLVESVGADGPCNAEDAAERAVEEITRLRTLVATPRGAGRDEVSEALHESVPEYAAGWEIGPEELNAASYWAHRYERLARAVAAARRGVTGVGDA